MEVASRSAKSVVPGSGRTNLRNGVTSLHHQRKRKQRQRRRVMCITMQSGLFPHTNTPRAHSYADTGRVACAAVPGWAAAIIHTRLLYQPSRRDGVFHNSAFWRGCLARQRHGNVQLVFLLLLLRSHVLLFCLLHSQQPADTKAHTHAAATLARRDLRSTLHVCILPGCHCAECAELRCGYWVAESCAESCDRYLATISS